MIILLVVACGLVMMMYEQARPARNWPAVEGWWKRAILFNGIQVGSVYVVGWLLDDYFLTNRLWAPKIGTLQGSLIGYFTITFVNYWWHRIRHESSVLWKWLHQFHHSPQRIEVITSFYKHPFEMIANSAICSFLLYLVLGLNPQAATGAVLLSGMAELFYHWNVATPHWLGYFIQRPESHCLHHQEGIHYYNFGDLPLWDIVFGTFRNPRVWNARCGFQTTEDQVSLMLKGKEIKQKDAGMPTADTPDELSALLNKMLR